MKQKNIKEKIKEYFFLNPTVKARVRQIERVLHVPLPSVIRYVRELEKEGILKRSVSANITTYSADRISRQFLLEKKFFNIQCLYASGLIDTLIKELSNPTIVVFGSYARSEDIETSDIDLYIETLDTRKIRLDSFEHKLQRKIQIFIYKNIHDIENKHLANNIVNGVLLNGSIEVF